VALGARVGAAGWGLTGPPPRLVSPRNDGQRAGAQRAHHSEFALTPSPNRLRGLRGLLFSKRFRTLQVAANYERQRVSRSLTEAMRTRVVRWWFTVGHFGQCCASCCNERDATVSRPVRRCQFCTPRPEIPQERFDRCRVLCRVGTGLPWIVRATRLRSSRLAGSRTAEHSQFKRPLRVARHAT